MEKVDYIWMDGDLVPWDDANVHLLTHSLHYGLGVFEGIRCYATKQGPAVFRLTDHMRRLHRSAKIHLMQMNYSVDELVEATKNVVRANSVDACYIRPLVWLGYGEMGLNPLNCEVRTAVAVWPWGTYLGEDGIKRGVRVRVSSYRRLDPNVIPPAAKATGQYINSILAKVEALKSGYDEAIMLNTAGFVTDGSGENIFVVRDGVITTPPTSSGALEGITRDSVMQIARDLGYEVKVDNLVRADLYLADEAFFSGTAAEVVPIREIDDRVIGEPGPITKKVQESFFSAVHGELERYSHWLEHV
ncbi:MAG: branched chain amino acid aminotransferase [Acidobacteria bacterium]|nr:MAG: branched chain amino acid aminotransferase [Acidobacteriota bacterium]